VVTGPLAWDEVAAQLARVLGEPVRGGLPLTPGWSSRMTWAAQGERTGPLVVKARRGEGADEKTAWCAAHLPLLAARGYPVPAIIWHGMALRLPSADYAHNDLNLSNILTTARRSLASSTGTSSGWAAARSTWSCSLSTASSAAPRRWPAGC
jgi:hypothetical protein